MILKEILSSGIKMGCCFTKPRIRLYTTSYTDYMTFPFEETFDIEMSEINIFLEENTNNIMTGKITFSKNE